MSERRRKAGSEGRSRKVLVGLAWAVVVLLLGGNIVLGLLNQKDDTPHGFIDIETVQAAGLWVPIGAALVLSVLGSWWATKAHSHSERTSLLWARRGHVFTFVGSTAFLMAVFDPEVFRRDWLATVAAWVVGGQAAFAAMSAWKEYRRAETGDGSRRPRGRLETPAMPAVPGTAPESPGPAK